MKWIDNEKSENYLIGFSVPKDAYMVLEKRGNEKNRTVRLRQRGEDTYFPVPIGFDLEAISMKRALEWLSLKEPRVLGNDDNGNKISLALLPRIIRGLKLGYFLALISENENWLLDRTLDPLEIKLEDAILEIEKSKEKTGFSILKKFNELVIYKRSGKFYISKGDTKYALPDEIDAQSLELSQAEEYVEETEKRKEKKEEIIKTYLAIPRMESKEVIGILHAKIFDNPVFTENLSNIFDIMIENKVEFYSPGGSYKRRVWQILMTIMEPGSNLRKYRTPPYIFDQRFHENILPIVEMLVSSREQK